MSRSEEFHSERITYSHSPWERTSKGVTTRGLAVDADHDRYGRVGSMELAPEPDENGEREVLDIGVMFKRHGIGTGMWQYAQKAGLNPRHSDERTDEGDAWARSVGGKLPPRRDNTSSAVHYPGIAGY